MRDLETLRADVAPTLDALEIERQAALGQRNLAIGVCLGGALIGLLAVWAISSDKIGTWWSVPVILALLVYVAWSNAIYQAYASQFKNRVLSPLVKNFGDLNYHPGHGIDVSEFRSVELFQSPDRFSSEDLIEGKIGATQIRFSQVHAEDRRTRTDSKGRTRTYYVTIFKGLFFVFDFNKHFACQTTLFPEGISGSLGAFGESLQRLSGSIGGRGDLVKLEDPRFENEFVVYSTDQIEARYILSSSLMERLCVLKAEMGSLHALFRGGQLFLLIRCEKDWFEPPPLGTALCFEAVQKSLCELELTTGIVEDLDLNTRIWSKE